MLTKILFVFSLVLLILFAAVYRKNKEYKTDNSRLILLNDSIMSVNIELKMMIDSADAPGKKTMINRKDKK